MYIESNKYSSAAYGWQNGQAQRIHFHKEKCAMHVVCCVWVHFTAHQAVGSDLLPGFLHSLTHIVSKRVDSGSCPVSGAVGVLQASAFCCSCKGILRSGWPHLVEIIYFCSAEVWEAQRNPVSANTCRVFWHPGACRTPWASWKSIKQESNLEPWQHCSVALLTVCFSFMAASVQFSAASSPSPGLHLQCLAQDWSWGLAPDFMNTIPPPVKTVWCQLNVKVLLFTS